MSVPGGFGRLGFGLRSFGAGGPLVVDRVLAIAGQVVRIVFNVEPLHHSAAGDSDALNPANYVFGVPSGAATSPVPTTVERDVVVGPAYGVGNGGATTERAVDVHVDRQLVAGVTYNVRVRNVVAAAGGTLGSPDDGDFNGVTRVVEVRPAVRNQDLIDFSVPAALGHYVFTDGDIGVTTPDESTKQRVFRRVFTRKDAFRFLPGYGGMLEHKGVGNTAQLAAGRVDMIRQIQKEPDVQQAGVQIGAQPTGLVVVDVKAKTRRGSFVSTGGTVSAVGEVNPT